MNRKQLGILLVLVVVIGGAGLWLRSRPWETPAPGTGKKLLENLPVNDITELVIKQGGTELVLAKTNDLWRVRQRHDYPASFSEISDFLLKARELKAVQNEKVGPSQLARLSLVEGTGTNAALAVEFKDKTGKTLKTLLLGKKHLRKSKRPSPMGDFGDEGYPDGRYVKVAGAGDNVAVINDALDRIEPKPEQWLNKDFFKVEKVRSVAVTFPVETNCWKITRETETGEWKLAEAKPTEQLDSGKASGAANPLNSPSFVDVVVDAKPEALGLDKPTTVTLDTFDNFTYTLKVGQKTNENLPITLTVAAQLTKERPPGKDEKPEDKEKLDKEFKEKLKKQEEKLEQEKAFEKWTYLVSNWTLDPLLKERAQMLVEKKEEPKKDESKPEEPKLSEEKPAGTAPPPAEPLKADPLAPPPPPAEPK